MRALEGTTRIRKPFERQNVASRQPFINGAFAPPSKSKVRMLIACPPRACSMQT